MKREFKGKNFSATFTDENGYYSLTGTVSGISGATGGELVRIDSDFAPLNDLHLCSVETGAPMHAWENARYHVKNMCWSEAAKALHLSGESELALCRKWAALALESGADELRLEIEIEIMDIWQDRIDELEDAIDELSYSYAPENRPEFVEPAGPDGEILPAYADIDADDLDRMTALARHLDCNVSQIEPAAYGKNCFEGEGKEFLVLTEDEADDAWDESLDNYIDDCLEIPDWIQSYFDRDAWKRDAKMDGRGHALSPYDGHEYDEYGVDTASGSDIYYIYRIN